MSGGGFGDFIFGETPFGGGGDVPTGPTSLLSIIPAYVYEQYNDDDSVQALFMAYNQMAQAYLDWFNAINLPIYTWPTIAGDMLDWVAEGLYGITRQPLALLYKRYQGPFNTYPYNTIAFNSLRVLGTTNTFPVNDDVFKRIITWNFYKGDGFQFNTFWLKRRIMRWLLGDNGTAPAIDNTYPVSVTFSGPAVTINITRAQVPATYLDVLIAALDTGFCALPFQFTYTIAAV